MLRLALALVCPLLVLALLVPTAAAAQERLGPLKRLESLAQELREKGEWEVNLEMELRAVDSCADLDDRLAETMGFGQDLKKVERSFKEVVRCWKGALARNSAHELLNLYRNARHERSVTRQEGTRSVVSLLAGDIPGYCEHAGLALAAARKAEAGHASCEERAGSEEFLKLLRYDRERLQSEIAGYEEGLARSCPTSP